MGNCPLCESKAIINRQDSASRNIYNCPNCGVFVVSDLSVNEVVRYKNEIAAFLKHRMLAKYNDTVLVSFEKANLDKDYLQLTVAQILEEYPKSFTEQTNLVLENLAAMSGFAGDEVRIDNIAQASIFYARKASFEAVTFVIKAMQKADLIDVNYYGAAFFPCGITVSPKGWDVLSERQSGKGTSKVAFVHRQRGESETFEQYYKYVQKAARECGFQSESNTAVCVGARVNYEIISAVKSAGLVICDLTDQTGEAFYTAALAHGCGKTCILTCNESARKKLPIDTSQLSVIFWDKPETLYLELLTTIKAKM